MHKDIYINIYMFINIYIQTRRYACTYTYIDI